MAERDIREIDLSVDHSGQRVSEAVYLSVYAEQGYEWVNGILARKMAPARVSHTKIILYLAKLIDAYLDLNPIGTTMMIENLMYVESKSAWRQPDIMIVLRDNPVERIPSGLRGAADICIEVVSPANADTDYGPKRLEYQSIGVSEYWILDPSNQEAQFMRLNQDRIYHTALHTHDGAYQSPLLPRFVLDMRYVWNEPRPTHKQIGMMVDTMWHTED